MGTHHHGGAGLLSIGLLTMLSCAAPAAVSASLESPCARTWRNEAGGGSVVIVEQFAYRKKQVELLQSATEQRDMARICVDGRLWPSDLVGRVGNGYASRLLPFQEFSELRDLIKALIDNDGVLYHL